MSENCLGNRLLALMSVLFAAAMAASPASAQATRTMKIIVHWQPVAAPTSWRVSWQSRSTARRA